MIECVAPTGDRCGEGAVWSAAEKAVYWTDINRFLIRRYDEASGSVRSWIFDEPVVAIALTSRADTMLVALASKLILWKPLADSRIDHGFSLDGFPEVRLNDGRPDPHGNFWVGSMKNNVLPDGELGEVGKGLGKLFRVTPDGAVTVWRDNLGISNTLVWAPDGSCFYFGDTLENAIYAYDYATGAIANERPFFTGFNRGSPDGSSIDAEGFVWNCRYGGRCIVRVAPDGRVDRVIDMPVENITTCTFGGEDLRSLYITTAASAVRGDRLAGSLFRLRVDVPGLPENRFTLA
jgi:sugar lactone lactonase YvrE